MAEPIRITTPFTEETARKLKAGDMVLISGAIYSARDAAHKRMIEALDRGEALPFDLTGQVIYYVGPTPAKPGQVMGSAGPTTSYRMDPYTPYLLEHGLKGMIGKGRRAPEVLASIKKNTAVYFGATGGTSVLLANSVVAAEKVAYEDLGPETVLRLEVKDLPLVVLADCCGGDLYAGL